MASKGHKISKAFFLFSFEPKDERNFLLISALASNYGPNKKRWSAMPYKRWCMLCNIKSGLPKEWPKTQLTSRLEKQFGDALLFWENRDLILIHLFGVILRTVTGLFRHQVIASFNWSLKWLMVCSMVLILRNIGPVKVKGNDQAQNHISVVWEAP